TKREQMRRKCTFLIQRGTSASLATNYPLLEAGILSYMVAVRERHGESRARVNDHASPITAAITITWSGQYRWQCAQGTGESPHLISAVEEALRFLLSDSSARIGAVGIRNDAGDPVGGEAGRAES